MLHEILPTTSFGLVLPAMKRRDVFQGFLLMVYVTVLTIIITLQCLKTDVDPPLKSTQVRKERSYSCHTRQQNLVFVKVHKCASTTVANALARFALKNRLNIGLPRQNHGHLGWPKPFSVKYLQPSESPINFIVHHSIFNRDVFQNIMPKDTKYVAILRHPFDQFLSTMDYFFELNQLGFNDSRTRALEFLADPKKYERKVSFQLEGVDLGSTSLTKNFMSSDLGMPEDLVKDEIIEYVRYLNRHIDLVMIADYLSVSLVLLRRTLCWSLSDVITLPINVKNENHRQILKNIKFMRDQHRNHSAIDYYLYRYFNATFWAKVNEFGRTSVLDEAHRLEILNEQFADYCKHLSHQYVEYVLPPSKWNGPVPVTRFDCELAEMSPAQMTMSLRYFMDKFRRLKDRPMDPEWMKMESFVKNDNSVGDGNEI